ncbi:hypothetical protein LSH36_816g00024 [Paralvinella palmiformis]|uniref:L-Fucosyltransferase n=1 Tax=Paralvinella palmiformis TaxID=53620 RepID=A0AAD9J008_9ANNE|nr:hypothetical protein LSH36_816g00024 [Paralvinella palmiformis]
MSQYSALLGVAKLANRIPILNPGYEDLKRIFTISTPIETKLTTLESFYRYKQNVLPMPLNVEATVESLKNISLDVMLKGFFHHFRYFYPVVHKLRKEFTFRKQIRQQVDEFFKKSNLTEKGIIKVGIHIRRTDLNTRSMILKGFGCPPLSYFTNAMNFFRSKYSNIRFVVCSDSMKWARRHFTSDDITFATNHSAEVDMAILTSCDHVIISNGTFSWWVGWLCRGTTVRYKQMPKYKSYVYNMTSGGHWPPDDDYNHYVAIDSDDDSLWE